MRRMLAGGGTVIDMATASASAYSATEANREPFYFQNAADIPAIAAIGPPVVPGMATVLQFIVPSGKNGMLWKLGIDYVGGGFTEGQGNLIWRLFRDPALTKAIYGFDNLVASIGAVNNPVEIEPIRVYEREVISIVAFNVGINPVPAGAQSVGVVHGWWYPKGAENPTRWP